MFKRFNKAWPAVLSGDPWAYGHALKLQGYYTADEAQYTAGVVKIFEKYKEQLKDLKINLPPPTEIARPTLLSATYSSASPLQTPDEEEESPLWSAHSVTIEASDD
jgi:hypothetical protein